MTPIMLLGLDYWYLAYTKPRQEQLASRNLQQQQFEVYFPLHRTHKQKPEGEYTDTFPSMFSRYLFFKHQRATQLWLVVQSTLGLNNLVATQLENATISNKIVSDIRQAETVRYQLSLSLRPSLRAATKVRIGSDSFLGLERLMESNIKKRLTLLLDILKKQTKVSLYNDQVEPIE